MRKKRGQVVVISLGVDRAIIVQELSDGIHLRLTDRETGEKLAKQAGGLPI